MKQKVFLSARWQKLVMLNYEVKPEVLLPYLPYKTELDLFEGKCLVSLVGFLFADTRLKGLPIPFHETFPEVNLRFYVKSKRGDEWDRGVVFISEIVPKPAIALVANAIFKEHYTYMPMRWLHQQEGNLLTAEYGWKAKGNWQQLSVKAHATPVPMQAGSEEEFIFEHYFGYSKMSAHATGLYRVEHPRWDVYPVQTYTVNCDFALLYGAAFAHLQQAVPHSVFMAEGSGVKVYHKEILR